MSRTSLSVQQVSKLLNVSIKTLHRWEKSGILVPRRTSGKHRRYSQEQISNFNRKKYERKGHALRGDEARIGYVKRYTSNETGIVTDNRLTIVEELGIPHVFSSEFQKTNTYLASLSKKRENIKPFHNVISSSLRLLRAEGLNSFQDLLRSRNPFDMLRILSLPKDKFGMTMNLLSSSQRRIIIGNLGILILVLFVFSLSRIGILGESFKAPIPENQRLVPRSGISLRETTTEDTEFIQPDRAVLAESTVNPNFVLNVNVPSIFKEDGEFQKNLTVGGQAILGRVTAPNVLYSLTAGDGITVSLGQTPTIANSGVLSFQSKTGAVTLTAGTGITIDGTKITNSSPNSDQNIFKTVTVSSTSFSAGSSTDTLTFAAGTGITITSDTTNKKLTIAGSAESGWTDGGTSIYLTTSTDSVGIGTSSPSTKLHVVGAATISDALTVSGTGTFNGSLTLGDDSSDTLTFNARSSSSIIPSADISYDLGSSSLRWQTIYANSVIGGGTGTQGHWQRASGVLSPANITDDLVIGATASSSSVFQVIGTGSNAGNTTIKGKTQLGDATGDTISIYGYLTAGDDTTGNAIEPSTGSKFDLGSSSRTWRNLYVDTITASGTTLSGTNSDDFRINADYTGDDGESSTLSFERGSPATNAVFKWNATGTPSKLFSLNAPLFINPDSGIAYSGTSALIVNQIQSQDIFSASASGNTKFKIDNSGNIVSVAGAKWEPLTDSTTALNIASSNGTSFVTFDTSNSRVGIGTTAPLTALNVTGSASLSANLSLSGAGTAHTLNVLDGGTLNVQRSVGGDAGVASSLFIDASGNVGIGTSAPAEKLEVSGNIKPTASTNNLGTVSLDTTADVTFSGAADSDALGTSVANAGDVNGDGYQDIIVGATGADAGGTNKGQAYIYYGGSTVDTTADITLSGDTDNKNFGRSVAGAGDVNGDGFDDVIVGQTSNTASDQGKIFVFYGGASMDTTADMTYTGTANSVYLGYSVSSAGDVNGDGYSDVIAGAYWTSPSELLPTVGEAYIFFGGPSFDNTVDVTLQGTDSTDLLGYSVSGAGDVNGDGFDDVIAGTLGEGSYIGGARIFYGGQNMDITADVTISGAAAADRMGASVAGAGDVNGDGYSDVIVGAIYADAGGTNRGRAYVYYGGASMNNTADVTISGSADNDELGEDVSSAGDVNGDGYADVIVGAKKADGGGTDRGQAYVYYGGSSMDNTVDVTFSGSTNSDNLGEEAVSGDFNGDGYIDVLVGTPGAEGAGTNRGQAYIYQGSGGRWLSSFAQNINLSRGLQIAGLAFDRYGLNAGDLFGIKSTSWDIDKRGTASFQDLIVGNTASASGNLSFSGARTIASTAMNTLTIGDSSTGNLIINPGGKIGLGTTAPNLKLDIQDTQSATAAAQVFNTNTGTDADGLIVKLGNTSTTAVDNANHFISFETSGIGIVGSVRGSGSTGVQFQTTGIADFAEYLRKDESEDIPYGSIVCLDTQGKVFSCTSQKDTIVGVTSKSPTILGGKDLGKGSVSVGLLGQVPLRVSAQSGEIKPGDYITSSNIPGVGVKAVKRGQVIGKALEPFSCHPELVSGSKEEMLNQVQHDNNNNDCIGEIMVIVNPSWYDPSIYIAEDGNLQSSVLGSQLSDPSLSVFSLSDGQTDQQNNMDPITENRKLITGLELRIQDLEDKVTSLSALMINQPFQSTESATLYSDLSSLSDLTSSNSSVLDILTVLGRTTLTDLGVTGNITAGLLSINGLEGEINTLSGDLKLQSLALGGIDMLNGKVRIDREGNIKIQESVMAKKIAAEEFKVLGDSNIGSAVLEAGSKEIEIVAKGASESSKIFLTPTTLTDVPLVVTFKGGGKFKVSITTSQSTPIKFDWWIVN